MLSGEELHCTIWQRRVQENKRLHGPIGPVQQRRQWMPAVSNQCSVLRYVLSSNTAPHAANHSASYAAACDSAAHASSGSDAVH